MKETNPSPIVLDCDTGVDDALAILYLIGAGAEIVAAGSVHGNVTADLAANNTLRVLELVGRADVPVAVGAARPLAQPLATAGWIHGEDGLGNTHQSPPRGTPVSVSAAEQLANLARKRPGELTVVATGPLTNLALALMIEPKLPQLVNRVVIMGGVVDRPGNVSPYAEANIFHDPEAADLVFGAGWAITMVGLDVTMSVLLEGRWLEQIERSSSAVCMFASAILQHYLSLHEQWLGVRGCALHDPMAAAIALDADLATYRHLPVHVELRGERTRGATLCDMRPELPGTQRDTRPSVAVATTVRGDEFRDRFVDALAGARQAEQ